MDGKRFAMMVLAVVAGMWVYSNFVANRTA